MAFLCQIANHPLLVRQIYSDEDVVCVAKVLYPKGVFGFECSIQRAIQEIKSYNDFEIHRVIIFSSTYLLLLSMASIISCFRTVVDFIFILQ